MLNKYYTECPNEIVFNSEQIRGRGHIHEPNRILLLIFSLSYHLFDQYCITIMHTTREQREEPVSYLTYPGPLNLAVLLLFVGSLVCSSGGIIGDSCTFVYATIDESVGDTLENYLPTGSRRGLGFSSWELESGECSDSVLRWKFNTNLYVSYFTFLGEDWRAPGRFGSMAYILSLFLSFFTLVLNLIIEDRSLGRFSLRHLRYTVPALCLVVLVPFQSAVTWLLMTSDFCDSADCTMGDGAWISIAAALCFFFSGLLFLVMGDPPVMDDAEVLTELRALGHLSNSSTDVSRVAHHEADAAMGKDAYEEASLADTEELTVEDVEDDGETGKDAHEEASLLDTRKS
jgi:hypothetical protein